MPSRGDTVLAPSAIDAMKKILLMLLLLPIFLLAGCADDYAVQSAYDKGYDIGYDNGHADGYYEGENYGYSRGFENGVEEGRYDEQEAHECEYSYWDLENAFDDGYRYAIENCFDDSDLMWKICEAAEHSAADFSEWHPEEALDIIECYRLQEPFWEDGSAPSHEDYESAVDCLVEFYHYFYSARWQ